MKCRFVEHLIFSSGSAEKPVKAIMTVRLVPLFLKGAFVQLLQTEAAHKMFRMEFPEHSSDTSPGDGLVTTCTQGAPEGMVVGLTVG